jgi:dihydroflavonol-4-reductase
MEDVAVVTGGAGFIGSHLVELLVRTGTRVRVLEKPGARVGHLPPAVEIVFADIRDREALARAMPGARRVYHLAANPHLWAHDSGEFDQVNFLGTVNVIDAALSAGAERVLHTSTESILTKTGKMDVIDENVEITPEDTVGPYCLSKLRAEQYAFALARGGHPVVVANPTMPIGPGDRGLSPPTRLVLDFCRGRLPVAMECTLNLIDVRDAALGLDLVMRRGTPGRRYLLGGTNVTLVGLLERLRRLTGVPLPRWKVPYPMGLVVAAVSEAWAHHITGRMPRATMTGVRLARRLMHFDPSRSLAELGLVPRGLDESLEETVTWLQSAGLWDGPVRSRGPLVRGRRPRRSPAADAEDS